MNPGARGIGWLWLALAGLALCGTASILAETGQSRALLWFWSVLGAGLALLLVGIGLWTKSIVRNDSSPRR